MKVVRSFFRLDEALPWNGQLFEVVRDAPSSMAALPFMNQRRPSCPTALALHINAEFALIWPNISAKKGSATGPNQPADKPFCVARHDSFRCAGFPNTASVAWHHLDL